MGADLSMEAASFRPGPKQLPDIDAEDIIRIAKTVKEV